MSQNPNLSISELATLLKEASPLESPGLARQLRELVDALRPQMADWLEAAKSASSVISDPALLGSIQQAVEVAKQVQINQAELHRVADQIRELRESGVLEQVLKCQQQLAEVLSSINKISGR